MLVLYLQPSDGPGAQHHRRGHALVARTAAGPHSAGPPAEIREHADAVAVHRHLCWLVGGGVVGWWGPWGRWVGGSVGRSDDCVDWIVGSYNGPGQGLSDWAEL